MPGPNSFTFHLVDELSLAAHSGKPISVPELHKKLIGRLAEFQPRAVWNEDNSRRLSRNGNPTFTTDVRRTPVYVSLTAHRPIRTIMLAPLQQDADDQSTVSIPDDQPKSASQDRPNVLLVVRVDEDEVSAREEIKNWILSAPPGVIEFKGFYKSYSTLISVEMALEVWDLLPSCPAVTFVGFTDNTEPITLPDDNPTLAKHHQSQASRPEFLSITALRNRLRHDTAISPLNDPQSDQKSFARLVSYANTISRKELLEWKRLHFDHKIETSLSTSLFTQFCQPLVHDKSISPDLKKCLLEHEVRFQSRVRATLT
jgi:hypothetical protein